MYDHIFQPIDVGPITIPNRIVRSAHSTALPLKRLIAYHEARAVGGVGMSTLEATGVHLSSPAMRSIIPLHDDTVVPFYQELTDALRPHGMKMLQQIYHPGSARAPGKGTTQVSASAIPNPLVGGTPIEMTIPMIDEMIEAFAKAAKRCRDGGLDGVDIHASSGYLIEQFLSPANNIRSDKYGGSLTNRMRFLMEIIEAIRDEVDHDICIGIRLPNEEYIPGGLTAEDNAEIARIVEPHVDYISLHMGSYWRFHKLLSPMDDPLGHEMPANEPIIKQLTKPTIVVGRIMTLDHAESIVESGQADMVSMVRALIADPGLVNKAKQGNSELIRPCIGSNFGCVGQIMSTGKLGCVVNIAAAQETEVSFEPEGISKTPEKILIVGGGPAGLEAARTAAIRGHDVHLHEATKQLGGQVAIAASAPHRSDLGAITSWLTSEMERLEINVTMNSLVDPEVIASLNPDRIIVATGSTPRKDGFQLTTPISPLTGFDQKHVYTSWDVFGYGGRANFDSPAIVFDDTGTFEAISVADKLLEQGIKVTMVSRYESLGAALPYPPATVEAAKERLMSQDFDFIGGHYMQAITEDEVLIGVPFTERIRALRANMVVLVTYNHPNRDLAEYILKENSHLEGKVHLVGDVSGTNGVQAAIHQAANLTRSI
ncbi:MAG: NADH:flavin oxidoreductase [Acidimicrobiaceae bacterium]|nr:NADH:flavin oxidoreductase [Acidimicrobiaceae bacterium]|tara:strand:- start:331 stop:2298 length:1968 start_codon:yes stop_codon:yes gene_type:complete